MNDLISRRAVINEIERWFGYLDEDMIARISIGISKLPSADRPRGHWIVIDEYSACSVCDAEIDWYDLPYCPYCGAKMDGERGEE